MRTLTIIFSMFVLGYGLVPLSSAEPDQLPPNRIVGSVYGKDISAADVGLTGAIDPSIKFDARDDARWELMGRIMTAFGSPIVERFVTERKIEATAEEIQKFQRNYRNRNEQELREVEGRLAEVKEKLAEPNLPNEEQARLEKRWALHEREVAYLRTPGAAVAPQDLARGTILAWKFERELHRVYGGRVIFQQAGLEALDARRRLFEQAEKNGNLQFNDAGVRHMFYYYANMRHMVTDEKALERPWFLDDLK